LGGGDPDIFQEGLLIPASNKRNAQINRPFGASDLATIAKAHFLIAFVLLKNYI
jgi:hypothetical protein